MSFWRYANLQCPKVELAPLSVDVQERERKRNFRRSSGQVTRALLSFYILRRSFPPLSHWILQLHGRRSYCILLDAYLKRKCITYQSNDSCVFIWSNTPVFVFQRSIFQCCKSTKTRQTNLYFAFLFLLQGNHLSFWRKDHSFFKPQTQTPTFRRKRDFVRFYDSSTCGQISGNLRKTFEDGDVGKQ